MASGSFLPAFLLIAPIVLAIIDVMGTSSGHSAMGSSRGA